MESSGDPVLSGVVVDGVLGDWAQQRNRFNAFLLRASRPHLIGKISTLEIRQTGNSFVNSAVVCGNDNQFRIFLHQQMNFDDGAAHFGGRVCAWRPLCASRERDALGVGAQARKQCWTGGNELEHGCWPALLRQQHNLAVA